jgi:hypothetical protein
VSETRVEIVEEYILILEETAREQRAIIDRVEELLDSDNPFIKDTELAAALYPKFDRLFKRQSVFSSDEPSLVEENKRFKAELKIAEEKIEAAGKTALNVYADAVENNKSVIYWDSEAVARDVRAWAEWESVLNND